ncbi:MAG TPA: ATP-binding protein [candidate division Zixibacteria bacterium]|nr:ATP-binding protein [candidate division Zixibacteria bacterium]
MNKRALTIAIIGIVLVLCYFWQSGQKWHGSDVSHVILETIATVLALFVGIISIIRYYALQDRKFLFIGIGFLGTSFLDFFHSLVSTAWVTEQVSTLPGSLQAWSWQASRFFLASLMLLTWRVVCANGNNSKLRKITDKKAFSYLGVYAILVCGAFMLLPLPPPYFENFPIGRPQELIAGSIFLAAFVGLFRSKLWQKSTFDFWLCASILVGFICQVLYMPTSNHFYDSMHLCAHLLKILSYLFVLTGLLINVHHLFETSAQNATELASINAKLQTEVSEKLRGELKLKEMTVSLEEKVGERTVELEQSRLAALNMMEDANEAKEAAEQAKDRLDEQAKKLAISNKELEQFAYVASHDLQEPLRTVGSFVQLLSQRYKGKLDSQADEFIQFAVEGVSRMRQLINDLLMFSRVETKGGELVPTDCEMVLGEVLANLKASIDSNNARITHDPLPMIVADKLQLSQVFQNLLGNAIKFKGDQTPAIHIGVNKRDNDWLFYVKDNGIGFDPEFSEKVFIIFQRLHTRNEYPGTGIGLSLCKKIVERHGGRIWVDSAPGNGSTFNFTIPDKMGEQNEYSSFDQANRNSVGRR